MIETTIKMRVPAAKRKEILQTMRAMLDPIRLERGCISCNCYEDVEDDSVVLFEEAWSTKEDLKSHLRSDHFGVLNGAMRMLHLEPEIKFNTIVSTAGPEAIQAARV